MFLNRKAIESPDVPLTPRSRFRAGKILVVACLLLVNVIFLLPLLETGYISDDAGHSLIRGRGLLTHESPLDVVKGEVNDWLHRNGRFYPLSTYHTFVFYVIRNVVAFKLFVLLTVLAAVAALYFLLRRLTASAHLPVLAALMVPLFLQFRVDGWDPITAQHGMMGVFAALLFFSLNRFVRYLDSGDRGSLRAAILCFVAICLMYEIAYPLFLAYVVIAYLRSRTLAAAWRRSWPFAAVCGAFVLMVLLIRATVMVKEADPSYTASLDPFLLIKSFLVQMVAGVPFSFYLIDPTHMFRDSLLRLSLGEVGFVALAICLAAVLAVKAWKETREEDPDRERQGSYWQVILALAAVAILSPLMICLSPRYQALPFGAGYMPSLITALAYAGMAAGILSLLWSKLLRANAGLARKLAWAAFALWGAGFVFGMRNNLVVARASDERCYDSRQVLEEACSAGLLAQVPAGSVAFLEGGSIYTWNNPEFYAQNCGRSLRVQYVNDSADYKALLGGLRANCEAVGGMNVCSVPESAGAVFIKTRSVGRGFGFASYTKVRRVTYQDRKLLGLLGSNSSFYFHLPESALESASVAVMGTEFAGVGDQLLPRSFAVDEAGLRRLDSGRDWRLFNLQRGSLFDAMTLGGTFTKESNWYFLYQNRNVSSVLFPLPPHAYLLKAAGPELLHAAYSGGRFGKGVAFPPVAVADGVSVEMLVTPQESPAPWATIIDNRDLRSPAGFAIEQVAQNTNNYQAVVAANGKWVAVGPFSLQQGCAHSLVLQIAGKNSRIYVDGSKAGGDVDLSGMTPSALPLTVGNWAGDDTREFRGMVNEIAIYQGRKPEASVAQSVVEALQSAHSHIGLTSCKAGSQISGLTRSGTGTLAVIDELMSVTFPSNKPNLVVSAGPFKLRGWAVDAPNRTAASGVEVVVDGVGYRAQSQLDRSDVSNGFKIPAYRNSGFQLVLPAIQRGDHRVFLRVVSGPGDEYYETPPLNFRVR